MRLCPARLSVALVSAALIFGALPASAEPTDSFAPDRLTATLMSTGQRAVDAASNFAVRLVRDGKDALAEAKTDAAQRFRKTLNERKARLGMVGEMHRSATEALDWFRYLIEEHSASPNQPDFPFDPLIKIERAT